MYGFGFAIRPKFAGGYDADAQAYFDAVTTPFSDGRKTIINNLVTTLKADGNWTKLDRLWLMATEAQDQALKSLVNPSSTTMTLVNSPTFTVDRGFTGDAATNYINTQYTPSVDTAQYVQNSASFGVYINGGTLVADDQIEIGSLQSGGNPRSCIFAYHSGGDAIVTGVNDANGVNNAQSAATTAAGFTVGQRTASASYQLYKNGTSLATNTTDASTGLPNEAFFILARNNGGAPSTFANRRIALAFIGSGTINQSTFHTAIQTYMTAIGAQY